MRERIVSVLRSIGLNDAAVVDADELIAAMPAMIADLVWDKHPDDEEYYCVLNDDALGERGYTVFQDGRSKKYTIQMRESRKNIAWGLPTLKDAQAAANAHHRATVMAAFGVTI